MSLQIALQTLNTDDRNMIKDVIDILDCYPDVLSYGNKDGWYIAWNDMKNSKGEYKQRLVPVIHVRVSGFASCSPSFIFSKLNGEEIYESSMDAMVQTCPLLSYNLRMIVYETLNLGEVLKLTASCRKALYTDQGRLVLNSLPRSRMSLYLAGLIIAGWIDTPNCKTDADVYNAVLAWEQTHH